MKKCSKCFLVKDLIHFGVNNAYKDGYFASCKECNKKRKSCDPGFKYCNRCEIQKPINNFKVVGKSQRISRYCIECINIVAEEQKDKTVTRKKEWYATNAAWWADFRVTQRLQSRYGVDRDWYESTFIQQNEVCAICKKTSKDQKRLHVDHNHETGQVRGLLCTSCNMHLGILENQDWVLSAQEYLSTWVDEL